LGKSVQNSNLINEPEFSYGSGAKGTFNNSYRIVIFLEF